LPGIYPFRHLRRVYCAGPLFNESERDEMNRIGTALRQAGFETFVPHADSLEFAQVHPHLAAHGYDAAQIGQVIHRAIFALDTYQVVCGCGALVLNMNGRVPDEGAVAEAAMAWALGKPIVIFKADARSKISGRDNPLIVGQANFETVDDIQQLGPKLAARVMELGLDSAWHVPCPAHLHDTLSAGGQLWQRIEQLGPQRSLAELAEAVLELFGSPIADTGEEINTETQRHGAEQAKVVS
jgi:nucleoside 2-deoxyribosyltransferase